MTAEEAPWSVRAPLADLRRGPVTLNVAPGMDVQRAIAQTLKLEALKDLKAQVRLVSWLDGVELSGDWSAVVTQICGVSLDPFETSLRGDFQVRCAPIGSPLLSPPESEVEIDLDADDPPDVLEHDWVDVAAYVVEHLALEIDPFPRKPGVEFVAPPAETPPSPFAVLARLQPPANVAANPPKPGASGSGDEGV
jgi:uncharacterized metal-binding protein YceD (DUF177 family)